LLLYAEPGQPEALAHLSSRGVHRIIEGTGHEIQLDKPQAVIDAVDDVLRELQTGPNKLTRSDMYPHGRTAA
jgi:hypothetical protein